MTFEQLGIMAYMLKKLVQAKLITFTEAETTINNVAKKHDLSPVYIG